MQTKEKYHQLECQAVNENLTSTHSSNSMESFQQSAIVESQAASNQTTSKGKLKKSKKSSKKQKSSKILVQDLTLKEKDLEPYWNDYCEELSSKLWLPTKTDLQDLDLKLSDSSLNKTAGKSWFSMDMWQSAEKRSLPQTYLQYFITSPVECTDNEAKKVCKIRIYPTTEQKKIFRQWFNASRKVYNETIEIFKLEYQYLSKKDRLSLEWTDEATSILKEATRKNPWLKDKPYQIKIHAIADAFLARKTNIMKGGKFELSFRSRKDPKQSCFIPKSALTNNGIYHTKAKKLKMHGKLPSNPCDLRLVVHNGQWFLHIPYTTTHNTSNEYAHKGVVALDPGIRTFLTGFSENNVFKIASKDFSRISRLCIEADKLISKINQRNQETKRKVHKSKTRCKFKKALQRIKCKIAALIEELHNKAINFLIKNFNIIILPKTEIQRMTSAGKLHSKSIRSMLCYSYGRFAAKLQSKAEQWKNVLVVRCSEAWTSKTASWNGFIDEKLNNKKHISSDGITLDRDVNGARGIFLRALRDSSLMNLKANHHAEQQC